MIEQDSVNNIGKKIYEISTELRKYSENVDEFLKKINALDRDYLESFLNEYKNREKINLIRYKVVEKILNNQYVDKEMLNTIKNEVAANNEKNILHSWNDFRILFVIYYNQIKAEVFNNLSEIAKYLNNYLLENGKEECNFEIKDFSWNQNFGTDTCWLVFFPKARESFKDSYQLFVWFEKNNLSYGLGIGEKLDLRNDTRNAEREEKHTEFDIDKICFKFLTVYNEFIRLNSEVSTEFELIDEDLSESENGGPQFLKTMIPILDELKANNGSGKSNEIIEKVIARLNITDEKMFEKYKSGQTRIYNQICWARNYLVEAGYISKEKRGIWELTEKGRNTELTEKDLIPLFKSVQNGLKKAKDEIHYWWLNANPKIWKIEDMKIGEKENYTTKNENGNKRRVYEYFLKVKKGDIVIGYSTSPSQEISAILEITNEVNKNDNEECIEFKKIRHIENKISINELKDINGLQNLEVLKNNQGSLFKVSKLEFEIINNLLTQDKFNANNKNNKVNIEAPIVFESYTKENALSELFIEIDKFDIILNTLKRKKNIILQGSPGVGKTFFAKRLAYTFIGFKDKSKVNMIQFHQSYSYEDFMQGFRPTEEGKFVLKNGVFYDFCQKAMKDNDNPYVFIIDEINRGNLSKIFGELMMLIETDKRGKDFSIPLTYSKDENETFFVPENVHIIGTMNTADRSLAIVDYALRRRFSFIDIEPAYNKQSFSDYLEKNEISKELIGKINLKLGNLNQIIEKDNRLGKGFRIGHSYFSGNIESENQIEWYKSIIQTEITPLILEYWFDDETQAAGHIEKLLEI